MKFHKNFEMPVGDMLKTQSLYCIMRSDLDLPYINLNYTFHTRSHDNDHLCFNPSIHDELMVIDPYV
jgi:hypothetical protein